MAKAYSLDNSLGVPIRKPRKDVLTGVSKVIFMAALLGLSGVRPVVRAETPPLRTLAEIHALSNSRASRHLPVDFEATVTYFRGYERTLFVQDGEAAIYVQAATDLKLMPGDRIRIVGTTDGSFKPIVVGSDIRLVRHAQVPRPVPAEYAQLVRAERDCRYVVVRGTVISANMTLSSGRPVTQFELRTDGGNVGVIMDSSDPGVLNGLLDSEEAVTGVVSGRFDGKMQQTGILLHVTSPSDLKMLRPAPMDAWSLPVTPMDQVLRNVNVLDRTARVRVEGVLTYYHPNSMAVLQDGARSIRVLTPQIDPLPVGARAETLGIPFVDNGFLTLKLGAIRTTGSGPPLLPRAVNWDELASGKYAFNLVSIEGKVVTQVREGAQDVYIISSGQRLFSAAVRHPFIYEWNSRKELPPMPEIQPGSNVRVTGVAILDDGNPFNGAMAFGILLRTSSDVVVLAPPSLWSVHNLAILAGVLLGIVVAVLIRGWSLEHRVRQQAALSATVERLRSSVLEDINRARPIGEIVGKITDLLSFKLHGAPCWCELEGGAILGRRPAESASLEIIERSIPSHAGKALGTIYAAIDPYSKVRTTGPDALFNAAQLAALAIETGGLYSDLVYRSQYDQLTDIHNRFALGQRLDALIAAASGQERQFGLIYVDLDDFKQVNDRYGHRVGDLYLQEVAQRMKRVLRPGDMLARLGGDEFAVVIAEIYSRTAVDEIVARLQRCFKDPLLLEGQALSGSASIGVAVFPEDGVTQDALLTAADAAMYKAKNNRREAMQCLARQPA